MLHGNCVGAMTGDQLLAGWAAFEQTELVPGAKPLDQLAHVGAVRVAPFLVETDDGVGGGGGVGIGRAREAPPKHREDFLAIDHDAQR